MYSYSGKLATVSLSSSDGVFDEGAGGSSSIPSPLLPELLMREVFSRAFLRNGHHPILQPHTSILYTCAITLTYYSQTSIIRGSWAY